MSLSRPKLCDQRAIEMQMLYLQLIMSDIYEIQSLAFTIQGVIQRCRAEKTYICITDVISLLQVNLKQITK